MAWLKFLDKILNRRRKKKILKDISGFDKMSKKERKNYLSNDMILRLIRVEQKVSHSFGEKLPYKKTSYYKSLSKKEKEGFDKFLKKRKRNLLKTIFGLISVSLIVAIIYKPNLTGEVINQSVKKSLFLVDYLPYIVGGIVAIAIIFYFVYYRRQQRINSYFNLMDDALTKKYLK